MGLRARVRQDRSAGVPVADVPLAAEDLELPAPAWLALTAGWNFAESLGLPLVAYVAGERLGGQGLGMAATAVVWLTAAVRKVLAGSIPSLLVISGLKPSAAHLGLESFFRGVTWLWAGIFAATAIGLAIVLAVEPASVFLLFTTVVTIAGVAAGTVLSVLWFIRMLRRCGLRVRFRQA